MPDALFDELLLEPMPAKERERQVVEGPFARVALERAVDKTLTYTVPAKLANSILAGQRVRVPLGRKDRTQSGYVVEVLDDFDAAAAGVAASKLKPVRSIEDDRVLIDRPMMELALWIGRYYCCALGLVLESMIPGAVKNRIGLGYTTVATPSMSRKQLQALFEKTTAKKRRTLLARLMQLDEGETIDLMRLAGESGVTVPTAKKLTKLGVITTSQVPDLPALAELEPQPTQPSDVEVNVDQARAIHAISPGVTEGGFATHVLLGVTGSGKTEVYLRLMEKCIAAGKQAVLLVPEIALTPQTTRRIKRRFSRVAVLHSGLSQTQRHRYWQQIAAGKAEVVVGARSAIFAPVPNPGLFVVDEEHESSYKQDQAPRYHARDVAIKRAQLAGCPVVLGSATPALETYHRAATGGSSCLHHLPSRVADRPMPTIELVDLKQAARLRKGVHLLSPRLEHLIRHTKDAGQQSILLLNRRGYASFVYNPSTDEPVTCRFCDATMTYHRAAGQGDVGAQFKKALHTGQLHCHYCLAVDPLDDAAKRVGGNLSLFGLGTQRMEEELARKFPDLVFERVDSDTMRRSGDYERVLERFARGEIDVLCGTQMIAKGLDFPNVSLVGVVSGDTSLGLPDFRAAERTFGLITQVAGRAGRGEIPGRVVLQTFNPFDEAIRAAMKQDYVGFARRELEHRRATNLPPFGRMVRIILRDREEDRLLVRGETLAGQLIDAAEGVDVMGPMPCPISMIAGYLRQQIVLTAPTAMPLQRCLARVRNAGALSQTDRLAVDVDPVNLL